CVGAPNLVIDSVGQKSVGSVDIRGGQTAWILDARQLVACAIISKGSGLAHCIRETDDLVICVEAILRLEDRRTAAVIRSVDLKQVDPVRRIRKCVGADSNGSAGQGVC